MKKTLFSMLLVAGAITAQAQTEPIRIDLAQKGAVVSPDLFGIFFEEISHAGELVVKVVNGTDKPYHRNFVIEGAKNVMPTGKVITLSGDANDENTFEMPTKLAPQTTLYGKFDKKFSYDFAPMSFTIMRLKVCK